MNYDKDLKFAEKYNWWSTEKENISQEVKISYIMSKWNLYELFYIFKNFDKNELEKWFELIKNDNFILKERRKSAIKVLFEEKNNNYL